MVGASACHPASEPTSPPVQAQPEGWDADIAMPTAADRNPEARIVEVELEAKLTKLEIKPGVKTEVWTYNGTVPGPILRAKKGDRLIVRFTNHLPEPTTIHWHGVRVPASMDGSEMSQTPVPPGGTFTYEFDLLDSGTFWYHPHANASAQVGYGLYGALIVENPDEPKLGDDLVIVLSDMGIEEDGTLTPGDNNDWFGDYFGREGAYLLVNGRLQPSLKGRVGVPQRWRVINAARSRMQRFTIPGQAMVRVGGDGGLIETPLHASEIELSPGERAEVVVTPVAQPNGPISVLWIDPNRFNLPLPQKSAPLFGFDVTSDGAATAPVLPQRLTTVPRIDITNALHRTVEFMDMTDAGESVLGINGKTTAHGGHGEMFHAQVGSVEVWELENSTDYMHPFHLHGFFFQVLDVDGKPWPVGEWKDTLTLDPHQKARIAIYYDDRPGMWMFHCHILDHADLGMMAMLMVMK